MSEDQSIPQQHCTTGQLYLSEVDFHECLDRFFRPFVSIRPIDWTCIKKSETYFAPFFKFKEFGDLYFDYVNCLIEDFPITDKAVTDSFIRKYYRFLMKNNGSKLTDPDEFPYPVEERQYASLKYCTIEEPETIHEMLFRPILYRHPKFMRLILRFNAVGHTSNNTSNKDLRRYIRYVGRCVILDPSMIDNVNYVLWNQIDNTTHMGHRRQKLMLMVMEFVLKVRNKNYLGSLAALWLLLFQAIPEPYITWKEIYRFLSPRLVPSENQESYIKSFRKTCKNYFPPCKNALMPRPLKHLVRCKVRKCLRMSLPHGVKGLGLPRELEDYLLLKIERDPFRPVIGPLSSKKVFAVGPVPAIQSSTDPNVYLDLPRQVDDC